MVKTGLLRALEMGLKKRQYKDSPLIHHSDRGLQYCANDYQETLNANNVKPSMTEKYDPYENAIAERINGILKQEFDIAKTIKSMNIKKLLIHNSIHIYNKLRPHLSNNMLIPVEMHKQNKLKKNNTKQKISMKLASLRFK